MLTLSRPDIPNQVLLQTVKTQMQKEKKNCGYSMGSNQYWAGRVYDLCVYYMTGTPEGSTESGFMEKPGIEPASPGLQGIALIHYTTGASLNAWVKVRNFQNPELSKLQS